MERHLLVVRHAKSGWDDPSLDDHERPLAPRGIQATATMSGHLAEAPTPDLVLCSTARRTVETLDGVRPSLAGDVDVELDDALYLASAGEVLSRLRRVTDDVRVTMVVGHNPGMQALTSGLARSGDEATLHQVATKFPTGAIATLTFEGRWSDLGPETCHLVDLFMPRRPR